MKPFVCMPNSLLLLILLFLFPKIIFAFELSPPVRINPDSLEALYPFITVDHSGKVWVFYEPDKSSDICAQYFQNGIWLEPQVVISGGEMRQNPIVDLNDNMWIFIKNGFDIFGKYFDGSNWSNTIYVPVFPSANFTHETTADSSGNIWVAWTTDWWGPYPIYMRYYYGETWSDTICIAKSPLGSYFTRSLVTDRNGDVWNLHLILISNSHLAGSKIIKDGVLTDSFIFWDNSVGDIKMAPTTLNNHVLLSTRSDEGIEIYDIQFSSLPDTTIMKVWEDSNLVNEYANLSINVNKGDSIWAFWSINEGGGAFEYLYLSFWNGTEWSTPELLMDTSNCIWHPVRTAYDPMRNRIWLTFSSRKDSIWGIYVSYIELNPDTISNGEYVPHLTKISVYPSPFTTWTDVLCEISESSFLAISIHDKLGRKITNIANFHRMTPGRYQFRWDGKDVSGKDTPSGIYFIKFNNKHVGKVVKVR